jgi:dATP pyrophosphohydrolase
MKPVFKQPVSILLVIYTRGGEVLVLKRCTPPVGVWQSVTGSLQWGEQPLAAARRELFEETGLRMRQPQAMGVVNRFEIVPEARHLYAGGVSENTEHVFVLKLDEACHVRLNAAEHSEYRWLPFDEAVDWVWSWSNKQAIWVIQETISD